MSKRSAQRSEQGPATGRETLLLPRDLPPKVWRAAAWTIAVIVGAAWLGAIFVRLPETVDSRFVLTPARGADPVKSPVAGTIEQIAIADGTPVRDGDLLFTIRSEDVAVLLQRIASLEKQLASLQPVAAVIRQRHDADRSAASARISRLKAQLAQARRRRATQHKRLTIFERSFKENLISELKILDARAVVQEADENYRRLEGDLEQAKIDRSSLSLAQDQELAERALELAKVEGEVGVSRAALAAAARDGGTTTKNDLFEVRAPYDGTVISLGPRRTGVVIERGDLLCSIARADARLVAELSVAELESGRVEPGQPVTLMLDAFPHIRYGTRSATVTWVSPTAVEGRMRTRAALVETSMRVGGVDKPLRAGMVGKAHVLVSWRTLAEFALEPLRTLRENVRAVRRTGE